MRKAKSKILTQNIESQVNGPPEIVPASARPKQGPGRLEDAAPPSANGALITAAQNSLGSIKSKAGLDLTEKVKELLRLAKEQGHLTYDDVNDVLPDDIVTPEDLDQ